MKRILLVLIPGLLLLAACGESERPVAVTEVASVGDDVLNRTLFLDLLKAIADNEKYIEAVTAQAAQAGITYTVYGEGGEGTFSASFTSEVISQWVFYTVLLQHAEERDIEITDELLSRAEVLISFVYGGGEMPPRSQLGETEPMPEGLEVLDAFDPVYRDLFMDGVAALLALEESIGGTITDEDVAAFYEENAEQFQEACAAHILIAPDPEAADQAAALAAAETEAGEVAAELAAGGDFAAIAKERSDDPGSGAEGGDLGCGPAGQYVPEFEAAVWSLELNTISEPIKTDFGFHLIRVNERSSQALEEVEAQIRQQLEGTANQDFQTEMGKWMSEADVTVAERYGTWNAEKGIVEAPVDPNATTTTTALPFPVDTSALPPITEVAPTTAAG